MRTRAPLQPSCSFSDWLHAIAGWIEANDDHADHHLKLLDRVAVALDGCAETSQAERHLLAEKVERYRYQHLNEHSRSLSAENESLADTLDLAAVELAGRILRPSRSPRYAINDDRLDSGRIEEGLAALDPSMPLERIATHATDLTQANFAGRARGRCEPTGPDISHPTAPPRRRMLVYAPLYVSNECINFCTYCGFRYPHDIGRERLSVDQVIAQAKILLGRGFRHLLVVSGDYPSKNRSAYFEELITALVDLGIVPAIEIAAQTTGAYEKLADAGVGGLTLYQETYDPARYAEYHIRGPKASFHWRLEAHDRAAEAGVARLGLGILLGLADPILDLRAMMRHAIYLADRFPDRTLAFSLPRIHEAPDNFKTPIPVSDEVLIRLYCALRIAFPSAELVLSTREPAALRNRLARICITQMSAGSATSPGGYEPATQTAGQQFPVSDNRSRAEVVDWLTQEGFQVASLPE